MNDTSLIDLQSSRWDEGYFFTLNLALKRQAIINCPAGTSLGQTVTVTDAVSTRTFTYTIQLQLDQEIITGLTNETITHRYTTSGAMGRPAGLALASDYDLDYWSDSYGRFKTVSWEDYHYRVMSTVGLFSSMFL